MYEDPVARLAEWSASTPVSIPDAATMTARHLLTDTIACMIAGTSAAGVSELHRATARYGGSGGCRIVGLTGTRSAQDAATMQALLCHARDYDDTHDRSVHHGCVTVVPALLALCDLLAPVRPVPGFEFIEAMCVGLDVSNRIGLATIAHLHTGWLPTTLWGTFGAAAACGRVLGLSEAQMLDAFGFAYTQSHGNRQALVEGTLAKRTQPGFAAAAGLRAAIIASEGVSGPHAVARGDFGIRALYVSGEIDEEAFDREIVEGLGARSETAHISLKPYPCCRCTHPVIDAALGIGEELPSVESIEHGIVRLPPHSMGQIGRPFSIRNNPTVDAQFSAAYTAALALTDGRPGLGDFAPEEVRRRTDLHALAQKFSCERFAPESSSIVPVELELHLRDGRTLIRCVEAASGSPERPMTAADRRAKFDDCLDHAEHPLERDRREALYDLLSRIADIDDMRVLITTINGA